MTKSRSVFGVDTIWEKEMAKLKVIQEAEERAKAHKAAEEALIAAKKEERSKKGKERSKRKSVDAEFEMVHRSSLNLPDQDGISPSPRVPDLPPQISYSPEKAPPPQIVDPITDETTDLKDGVDLDLDNREGGLREDYGDDGGSSQDEETPLKSHQGKAQRSHEVDNSPLRRKTTRHSEPPEQERSDSEEDVPLSRMIRPGSTRLTHNGPKDDEDSEEDVPLSKVRHSVAPSLPAALPSLPAFGTGSLGLDTSGNDSEEDDVPLMLRRTAARPSSTATGPVIDPDVEDDLPLGFKHADAVIRKQAEGWRNTMGSPYGMPNMMGGMNMAHMSMPPMMAAPGYAWGYGAPPPNLGLGYLPPAMPMGGWAGMAGIPPMPDLSAPAPPAQNIETWRKEVAIQPVATGGAGSVRSGS
jgi:hypothetical protein